MLPVRWAAFRLVLLSAPAIRVRGVLIVDLVGGENSNHRLTKISEAIKLVRSVQPWRESSCIGALKWILVTAANGEYYNPQLNACVLDVPYVEQRSIRVIAAMLVHEGTHARLWRLGFRYEPGRRARIERLATEAQADFFSRTPNGEALAKEAMDSLRRPWWE